MPANDMKTKILYVREKCYTIARRSYDVVNKAGVIPILTLFRPSFRCRLSSACNCDDHVQLCASLRPHIKNKSFTYSTMINAKRLPRNADSSEIQL